MASELLVPPSRALDANANPYAGAKWYFYQTGTLTPQTVYTTSALNVAHANPVVADAGGKFANIFFNSALTYRGVLKDASDTVTLHDIDPINDDILSQLIASSGSSLVGFLQAGTGAVARTAQAKMRDVISVKDFGATGDGVTSGQSALIQAAIDAVNAAGGGVVFIPRGVYLMGTTVLSIKSNVILQGEGYNASILQWSNAHTGDGIKFSGNVNHNPAQALAFTEVRDLQIKCTNGSNTAGGGYVDVAGTFLALHRVKVDGFGYSCILDQSELAEVDLCIFQSSNTALLWLVNGPGHTAGAAFFFTNRISVTRTQLDNGVTIKPLIQDDGGYCHSFSNNNFNGGTYHLRAAGVSALKIESNEWEGNSANPCIILTNTAVGGAGVGSCSGVAIDGNLIVPVAGQSCINIVSCNGLNVSANFLQTSASIVKINGAQNCAGLIVGANALNGAGAVIDNSQMEGALTLAAGINNNCALPYTGQIAGTAQFISIEGPGSAFSVTGFVARYNGDQIIVYNSTAFTCTVKQNDANSAANNRIFTRAGIDLSLTSGLTAAFIYRINSAKWVQIY